MSSTKQLTMLCELRVLADSALRCFCLVLNLPYGCVLADGEKELSALLCLCVYVYCRTLHIPP